MRDARGVLRPDEGLGQVRPFELFFDLVFVFALTQLSHRLLDHLTLRGTLETLLLLLALWSAWVTTTWFTNWFDPDRNHVRHVLAGLMLASLFMGAAIPAAFEGKGLLFGAAFAALQVGRALFGALALSAARGHRNPLSRTFQRTLTWHSAMGVLWVSGGALGGSWQYVLWCLAAGGSYLSPMIGYYTPGLGRARTEDWPVDVLHFAERCRLFVIIALGESLLVIGTTLSDADVHWSTVAALSLAFLSTCAMWWIYFDGTEEDAERLQRRRGDSGRVARSAYTYDHLPIIAGVLGVAAFDELVVAHPLQHSELAAVALALGGSAAFLTGHLLFERAVHDHVAVTHLAGLGLLAALALFARYLPLIGVAVGVAAALIVVAVSVGVTRDR